MWGGWAVDVGKLNFAPIAGILVTYDTVVFGFTATAIALAIAIPSPTFIKFLSSQKDGSTPFRDFLFILAWNGFCHIFAFFITIPIFLIENPTFTSGNFKGLNLYIFFLLWVQMYCIFQFMVTTISVYELGDLYANYVAREPRSGKCDRHPDV